MNTVPEQTPLVELLSSAPKDGRVMYVWPDGASQNIPYGRLMHEAADRITELEQQLADKAKQIVTLRSLLARASEVIGRFTSDEGWAQADMDTMDDIDSTLAATEPQK
jgi:hypothetical protein